MKEQSVPTKSGVGMRIGICISIALLFLVFGGISKGWTNVQSKSNVKLCQVQDGTDIAKAPKPARTLKKTGFRNVPLYFIPNQGQVNPESLFLAKTPRYTLWLTGSGGAGILPGQLFKGPGPLPVVYRYSHLSPGALPWRL